MDTNLPKTSLRTIAQNFVVTSLLLFILLDGALGQTTETVVVDGSAAAHDFPHFWEQMFGSGRAELGDAR